MKVFCYFVFVSLLLFIFGCDKYNRLDNLRESIDTCRIYGRIFLYDTLTQQGELIPQSKKRLTITAADQVETLDYLYSTTSDENGYFEFKYLTRQKAYRINYEEAVNGRIIQGDTVITPPLTQLQFEVSPSLDLQKGIYYRIVDEQGNLIPKASICIYTNEDAYLSGKCETANYNETADAYGRVFVTGLPQGRFYSIASVTLGGSRYTTRDTVDIDKAVVSKRLCLSAVAASSNLQYTIKDVDGFIVKGAEVCLFLNPAFAQNGGCSGSVLSDSTNAQGQVVFKDLTPATYYVNCNFQVGAAVYKRSDVVTITANESQQRILQLQ
ncbi:MAG: hypothetical protein ABWZ25_17065 [Chitinophagaceae bacterium]